MRVLLVAGTDLKRRVRNRSAIVTAVIGPLALAVVFSVLIGGGDSVSFTIGVTAVDPAPPAEETVGALLAASEEPDNPITFRRVDDEGTARLQVDDGDLDAALVIPAGFGTAGDQPPIVVLRDPSRLVSGQVAESVATRIASQAEQVRLSVATAAARSGEPPDPDVVSAASDNAPVLELTDLARGTDELSAAAYFGSSMSIVFLFFTVGFATRSLLAERRDGTLARVLASGTSPGAAITGKSLSVGVLGLAGLFVVWAVTTVAFGADWGAPAAVVAVMVATVLAVGGVSTLVASLARSERQADSYTAAVTFVLALLGGNFVPPGEAPELLQRLSLVTPNGWALKAFTDLSADAASLSEVATALAVLLGIAAVGGGIGLLRVRRLVMA